MGRQLFEEMVPIITNRQWRSLVINQRVNHNDFSQKIVGADDLLSGGDVSNVTAVYNLVPSSNY